MRGPWLISALLGLAAAGCSFFVDPIDHPPVGGGGAEDFAVSDPFFGDLAGVDAPIPLSLDLAVPDLSSPPDLRVVPDLTTACASSCSSCGATGCCADVCGGGVTCDQKCTGCRCDLTCDKAPGGCSFTCQSGSTCNVHAKDVGPTSLTCSDRSTCELTCGAHGPCSAACTADSECLVHCNGAMPCIVQCVGTKVDCGNGVQVCNRLCPP
jgi:hypothetical protein